MKIKIPAFINFFLIILGLVITLSSLLFSLNKGHIGLAFLLPPLICMTLEKRINENRELKYKPNQKIHSLLTIMYILIMFLALLEWNRQIYQRSIIFFVLITVACLLISVQIILFPAGKSVYPILLEIFAVAIFIRGSVYFNFPTVYGHDPFFHIAGIEKTIQNWFLSPDLDRYVGFSYFHLLTALIRQILGIELKNAYFINSIIEVICAFFVFLISRILFNEKMGLLSTAIVLFSPYNIVWGFWIIPMTLGLVFFMIVIYLIVKKPLYSSNKLTGLLLFFSLSSLFIHPVSSFINWILFALFFIITILNKNILRARTHISFSFIVLITSSILFQWMHIYQSDGLDFFSISIDSLIVSLMGVGTSPVTEVTLAPTFEYSSIFLNDLPFTLLIFFGILGSLFFINNDDNHLDQIKFVLAILPIFFLIFIYAAGFLAISAILPARWFVFIEVLLAFFASYGVFSLISVTSDYKKKLILFGMIILIFTFSAITTPITNSDSAFYSKELAKRAALIESDVTARTFIDTHYAGPLSGSGGLHMSGTVRLDPTLLSTYEDRMVVVREYDLKKGFNIPLYGAEGKLLEIVYPYQDFFNYINSCNKIYGSSEVNMYHPP